MIDKYEHTDCVAVVLRNYKGTTLTVTNFGASVVSLEMLDKRGAFVNVIVGLDTIETYREIAYHPSAKFLGASIGRYAGRISKGSFDLNDQNYPVYQKNGVHLHGGLEGFDKKIWRVDSINEDTNTVVFSYNSKHKEEGYPGNLEVKAIYELSEDNALTITYKAISDQNTFVNLTNHSYFNLNGSGSILDHKLFLDCSGYLEVDTKKLPTGKINSVTATAYDFLNSKSLQSLSSFGLIDDTLIYNTKNGKAVDSIRAKLVAPTSGLQMEIKTNQPAVVIYTPEYFPNWGFKNQVRYDRFPGICFENQNYPDAPHHNHFPPSLLKAGGAYENKSVFQFSTI
ncbi:aldose epimerase family protein [Aquimarina sp. M1]